jgi:spore maturation protein CgeB
MKLVVLGLSLSSSWGNGHATTWRALLAAFAARGHDILFLERDKPWYAEHRDLSAPGYCRLELYESQRDLRSWVPEIADADAVIVGSYVPEGIAAGHFVQDVAEGVTAFYDIDTPVTMAQLAAGSCDYVTSELIAGYDLYLSFTGGPMLRFIEEQHGSPAARPLCCSVDPLAYPSLNLPKRWDLSYLGTYGADRQPMLERLLIEPARLRPDLRFAVAGPQYPETIDWPANVERIDHIPPADHALFYNSARYTLNVTRADMVAAGWSPSVRLFEAAATGTPIISDVWPGIGTIFDPEREIILAEQPERVIRALDQDQRDIGRAARQRVLEAHSASRRAEELENLLLEASRSVRAVPHVLRDCQHNNQDAENMA